MQTLPPWQGEQNPTKSWSSSVRQGKKAGVQVEDAAQVKGSPVVAGLRGREDDRTQMIRQSLEHVATCLYFKEVGRESQNKQTGILERVI